MCRRGKREKANEEMKSHLSTFMMDAEVGARAIVDRSTLAIFPKIQLQNQNTWAERLS